MTTDRSWRSLAVAISVCAVLGSLMAAPALSSANLVDSLLERTGLSELLGRGGGEDTSTADRSAAPATAPAREKQAGTPPEYTPPEHGTNPHGQGAGAIVDLTPEDTAPLGSENGIDPSEEVAVGVARGEQQADGSYRGSIVLASLLGAGLIEVETGEGETATGPLQPLQDALDSLCTGSGDQLCLELLAMSSETNANGSSNRFAAANADVGGPGGITASAIETNGNISESGGCQTSHGDSLVADAGVLGVVDASAVDSSSDSESCTDGSTMQTNSSSVVGLNGMGLGIPEAGCADGTPDSNFTPLSPLVALVCNADDSNGAQSNEPYGVREGLTAFVLDLGGTALVKATTSPSESQAREAGGDRDGDGIPDDEDECPNRPGPESNNGCPEDDGDRDGDGIPDNEDACPNKAGPERFDGCPDSDGDGIPDNEDACPQDAGPERFDGCPDSDGDGLPDNIDECPNQAGPESNNGCPLGGVGGAGAEGGAGADGADDALAVTGADIGVFGLIGLIAFGLGLLGMAIADRRLAASR